jgi:putative spermidine/putrescine transport system ATP-binding protein
MQAGRIEQVGTPFEIYNRPATPFVASFIGNLNLLEAEVLDATAGLLAVDGQEVRAAGPVTADGPRVKLALRPEMLALEDGIAMANSLAGTLANIIFLGSIVRLVIRVGSHELFLDRFNAPHLALPAVGSKVSVGFAREACLVSAADAPVELVGA